MALKVKRKTLADKINALITTTPATFNSDDDTEDTKAKVVEQYDEGVDSDDGLARSKIRGQAITTLDELDSRYAGRKVSRKDIYHEKQKYVDEDSDDDDGADEDEDEKLTSDEEQNDDSDENDGTSTDEGGDSDQSNEKASMSEDRENSEDQNSREDDEEKDGSEESGEDEEYGFDIGNPLLRKRDETNFKTMSEANVGIGIEKGNCVRNQLKIWENLLEMRIKLQKCVVNGNQMPQYDVHPDYRCDNEFTKKTIETKSKLTQLLNNLLTLQSSLLKQYGETEHLNSIGGKANLGKNGDAAEREGVTREILSGTVEDEEIPSDTDDENDAKQEFDCGMQNAAEDAKRSKEEVPKKKMRFSEYETILSERHATYSRYRDSVIQKWNEKTKIASGNLNKMTSQTTLKQIEFALADKVKLRRRTQLKRSEYTIVGKPEIGEDENGRRTQEYDPEIFDDDDFYHQLLRDLIEYKSSDVTDPIQLSKRWIQLQNMRNKMKRKIDTRATKGRRIRYNVHNKLVNFMAPILANDAWTDAAKNELYNSLFGKIKTTEETCV